MIRPYITSARHLAVQGVAAIVFGILTLVWPDVTLWTLVVLWGAYAFVDGTVALSAAITDRLLPHRGWVALSGVSGIVAGLVTFFWPGITALALLYVIAVWAFVVGTSQIAIAITERKQIRGEWALGLTGLLTMLLGVVLLITPGSGALAITWAIGWWACLYGSLSLAMAWTVRHASDSGRSHTTLGAPTGHLVG
jgi:uncharacterized membrane protein HdeD (DUF308 family)